MFALLQNAPFNIGKANVFTSKIEQQQFPFTSFTHTRTCTSAECIIVTVRCRTREKLSHRFHQSNIKSQSNALLVKESHFDVILT